MTSESGSASSGPELNLDATLWLSGADVDLDYRDLDLPVRFRAQLKPVEARRRVVYRTSLLVLALSYFNRSAAKIENVHTLMWAMRTAKTRKLFQAWWAGRRYRWTVTHRFDPDLDITIRLSLADGLISINQQKRIGLTERGRALAQAIKDDDGLMRLEKELLSSLPKLSDASISRRLEGDA